MIKIISMRVAGPAELALQFNDGSTALWSGAALVARNTELTAPLGNPAYFARAFLEAGALAWPNGLELSPASLYRRLDEAGALVRRAA